MNYRLHRGKRPYFNTDPRPANGKTPSSARGLSLFKRDGIFGKTAGEAGVIDRSAAWVRHETRAFARGFVFVAKQPGSVHLDRSFKFHSREGAIPDRPGPPAGHEGARARKGFCNTGTISWRIDEVVITRHERERMPQPVS